MPALRPVKRQFVADDATAASAPPRRGLAHRWPPAHAQAVRLSGSHLRNAAMMLALLGIGLAVGVPFALGPRGLLASLRTLPAQVFLGLAASAAASASITMHRG